jgi:hypothetical protein
MSTGGFAINAIIKTEVATRRQGIIRTPNHPTYNRLFVLVTHWQKFSQRLLLERVAIVAVIRIKKKINESREDSKLYFPSPPSREGSIRDIFYLHSLGKELSSRFCKNNCQRFLTCCII